MHVIYTDKTYVCIYIYMYMYIYIYTYMASTESLLGNNASLLCGVNAATRTLSGPAAAHPRPERIHGYGLAPLLVVAEVGSDNNNNNNNNHNSNNNNNHNKQ